MKRTFFSLMLSLGLQFVYSQQSNGLTPLVYNIIPPSPNASAIGKFGDIPVSNYTGIPRIDVPVYSISTGDLQLPVLLSYHAGGIKVDEIASNAGLGWALNSGGMISRTVRGLPDESQFGYLNNGIDIDNVAFLSSQQQGVLLENINNNLIDLQPDVYNYSFFGKGGKFIIDRVTRKGYLLNNNEKINIQWNLDGSWLITDASGIKYYFGAYNGVAVTERSIVTQQGRANVASINYPSAWPLVRAEDLKANTIQFNYQDYSSTYCLANQETKTLLYYVDGNPANGCDPFNAQTASWDEYEIQGKKISSIVWKNGSLNFAYSSTARLDLTSTDNILASITVTNNSNPSGQVTKFVFFHSYFTPVSTVVSSYCAGSANGKLRLDKILQMGSDNTQSQPPHEFFYEDGIPVINSKSQDHWGYYNGQVNNTTVPKMFIINGYQNLISLDGAIRIPNLFSAKAGTLTKIKYPTGGQSEFTYELHDAFMKDFNFEGTNDVTYIQYASVAKSSMTTVPVATSAFTVSGPYNPATQKAGFFVNISVVLNGTCDPSIRGGGGGGCGGTAYIQPVPGTPGSTWQFGNTGNLSGTITQSVFLENGSYQLILEGDNSIAALNINSCNVKGPDPSIFDASGNYNKPIGGLRIKKISSLDGTGKKLVVNYKYRKENTPASSSGVLVSSPGYGYLTSVTGPVVNGIFNTCYLYNRTSSSKVPLGITQGSHIGYSFVEITKGEEGVAPNTGKSTNSYTTANDFPDLYTAVFPFPPATSYDMRRGLLLESKDYKFDNGIYTLVNYAKNIYTNMDARWSKSNPGVIIANQGVNSLGKSFVTKTFQDVSKWVWLNEQISRVYSSGSYVETSIKTFYDNTAHLQPTKIEKTLSDGSKEITYLKYAADFSDAESDQVTIDMKGSKHIHNAAIQKTISKMTGVTENATSGQVIKYANNLNAILPVENIFLETLTPLNINDPLAFPKYLPVTGYDGVKFKRRGVYTYDSYGNLISQQKESDMKQSYIWDYNSTYPVAQVSNALQSDIAYTSFEADGKGNWAFTGTLVPDPAAPTGKRVYDLASGSITRSIGTAGNYIVSYWSKPGTRNVNSTTVTTGRSINNWTYNEHKVTLVAGGTVTVNGSGMIDELRLYPEKALVTTMTYEPLIGITSQCDANNRINYYDYDVFNRLILIRDQDKNAVKKICYNYAGQPESCGPVTYSNVVKSGTFTRNNCSAGYIGGSVTYSVPAGTYTSNVSQADADQLAQNDVNANGQNNANVNGTCTGTCTFGGTATFSTLSSGFSPSGGSVSFYIAFETTNTAGITWSIYNLIGTVTGVCNPSATRILTMSSIGRTWNVKITTTGQVYIKLLTGTNPASGAPISLSGGSYSL
jgi:Family of unknown function (DUF5977)